MQRLGSGAVLALLVVSGACASGRAAHGALHPTDTAQAVEGAPGEGQAEVGRVAVRASIGGWEGRPPDLELRLTPVDVTVGNGSDRPVRLGPEAFRLVTPSGGSYRVLTQEEVSAAVRGLAGFRPQPTPPRPPVSGFPGYDSAYVPGRLLPVPAPRQWWYETQLPSGTLDAGRQTSLLLFFDVPARSLGSAALEVQLVDASGAQIGTARIPFSRD